MYLLVIGALNYGFDKVQDFKLQDLPAKTKFSIVIPFRNEAENLPRLLNSIANLNYPQGLFEVILVDDDSEDDSILNIEKFISGKSVDVVNTAHQPVRHSGYGRIEDNIRVIKTNRTSNSPKKDAITTAIKTANFDWIITTDADCVLPRYWLDTFDEFIQIHNPNGVVAPVSYHGRNSFLNRFQVLDFLSLQGATIGGFGLKTPFLCNGANFGYRKSVFCSVNGFEGNLNIASGDDIFLLEKLLKQDVGNVHYLKSKHAIVTTDPAKSLNHLIEQRIRWASKTSRYNSWFAKLVGLIVLLGNLVGLALVFSVVFNLIDLKIAIALFVIKFSIDFLLLFKTSRFFKQESVLLSYLLSSLIYPFFSVGVAVLSLFKSYKWKGRTFSS